MTPATGDPDTLIVYRIDDDECPIVAITTAFRHIDLEPYTKDTVLDDWINCDGLMAMRWDSNDTLHVSTDIWDHPVTITAETITIYTPENHV